MFVQLLGVVIYTFCEVVWLRQTRPYLRHCKGGARLLEHLPQPPDGSTNRLSCMQPAQCHSTLVLARCTRAHGNSISWAATRRQCQSAIIMGVDISLLRVRTTKTAARNTRIRRHGQATSGNRINYWIKIFFCSQ